MTQNHILRKTEMTGDLSTRPLNTSCLQLRMEWWWTYLHPHPGSLNQVQASKALLICMKIRDDNIDNEELFSSSYKIPVTRTISTYTVIITPVYIILLKSAQQILG